MLKEVAMTTESVRLNITLPADLAKELKHITASRKQSKFVAEAVEQKINQLKQKQMENDLAEGYKATSKEGIEITKDFDSVDLEGWDDY
jgi:metal-responsive CopG/Arc/MetJ family transcriptional regulator